MRDQQERYDSCEEKYDTWLMTFPFPTKESLVEYAVLLSAPVITYYNNLFLTNTGDKFPCEKLAALASCLIHSSSR